VGFDVSVDGGLGDEQPAADLDVDHFSGEPVGRAHAHAQPFGQLADRQQARSRERWPRRHHGAQ
jgi:hypothetical protein